MPEPTAVQVFDFFSGCGGASCGFRSAGMEIAFALDHDADAKATFRANFPKAHFELAKIQRVDAEDIRRRVDAARPRPVLFSGCAPCQPFSRQKTTRPPLDDDERAPLLTAFARLVAACKPDIVFVENVPGIESPGSGPRQPFRDFLRSLKAAGYHADHRIVTLAKYGVPQGRRRLVLVASRHGGIRLPDETHGPGTPNGRYETVRDWIGHLPPVGAGESHPDIPNHRASSLSELNSERIRSTPEGGGHPDWPERLKLDCHKGFSGYGDVYGRMSWDKPAPALTTRCTSYSNGRFGHPEQDRAISAREAACLQTFPECFSFKGGMESMAKQIGNAVPVRLAELVGKAIIKHLNAL